MDLGDWPILYHDILRIKDKTHHLGICTLWTERDVVEQLLTDVPYCVIGNLYSGQGINAMIRNVMANPHVRTIVIWGSEMSLSGHSLLKFSREGLDDNRKIIGGRGEIEPEIPDDIIREFREKVEVIDLRGTSEAEFVAEVKKLAGEHKKPFASKARTFTKSQPSARVFPSGLTGYKVSGRKVAKTWLKLLNEIYRYGRPKFTRYSQDNEIKEILNLTAVVTNEDPETEYFPEYLPFTEVELKAYYAELMTDREIPGVAYNYGKLLRRDFGIDQVEQIKKLIAKRPTSKKMTMTLIDPKRFWEDAQTSDTPCLTQVFGSVQENMFFLTAHFRSQDMVHGWPRNTFALRKLQKDIADAGKLNVGPLTMITHSAHIYGDDFKLVENILHDWYEKEQDFSHKVHYEFDPRGNWVIEVISRKDALIFPDWVDRYKTAQVPFAVEMGLKKIPSKGRNAGKLIRATLFAPNSGPSLAMFEGRTAQEVAYQINDWEHLENTAHAMYVGMELQRAEAALISGKRYHQDPA